MRYIKSLGILISAIILSLSAMAVSASAQTVIYRRPVIVRQVNWDPFWRSRAWYDPTWNDPFYWEVRERYYNERAARDARKKLDKDRQKYSKDGYVDAKEQEKLMKDQRDYAKAVERVRRDRDY